MKEIFKQLSKHANENDEYMLSKDDVKALIDKVLVAQQLDSKEDVRKLYPDNKYNTQLLARWEKAVNVVLNAYKVGDINVSRAIEQLDCILMDEVMDRVENVNKDVQDRAAKAWC